LVQAGGRYVIANRGIMILVLGILSLVPCVPVGLILGPLAWAMGFRDLWQMTESRMDGTAQGSTRAGMILGTAMAVLLFVLGLASSTLK